MSEHKEGCFFSSGIDDSITCSKDGVFDDLGFPVNSCDDFPCNVIIDLTRKEEERERRLRKAAPKMYDALEAAVRRLRETSACGLPDDVDNRLNMICADMQAALEAAGGDNDSD